MPPQRIIRSLPGNNDQPSGRESLVQDGWTRQQRITSKETDDPKMAKAIKRIPPPPPKGMLRHLRLLLRDGHVGSWTIV